MTSTYDLDKLAALEAAATSGEWKYRADSLYHWWTHEKYAPSGAWAVIVHVNNDNQIEFLDDADAALICAARNALPAMIADLKDMREMLREVEWAGYSMFGQGPFCVCCGKYQSNGHAEDCRLDALKHRLEGK